MWHAGTGKTLSLICSALQWLEDEHALRLASKSKADTQCSKEDEEPDWMRDFEANKEEQKLREKEEKKQQRKLILMNASAKKVSSLRSFFGDVEEGFGGKQRNGKSKKPMKTSASALEDDEFLVEDYCSDDNASRLFYTCYKCSNLFMVRSSHLGAENARLVYLLSVIYSWERE